MRADDAFWGARLVARFSDQMIRAIVEKGRYTEPGAEEHIAATLIKRRDKVLRAWLPAVNPLVEPRLAADGTLTFDNAAESAGVAPVRSRYTLLWSRFDNTTNTHTASVEATAAEARAMAPASVLDGAQFVSVAVRTTHPDYPVWAMPVTFTFRRVPNGWQAVGLERAIPPRPER
jgi:hypothetical protein